MRAQQDTSDQNESLRNFCSLHLVLRSRARQATTPKPSYGQFRGSCEGPEQPVDYSRLFGRRRRASTKRDPPALPGRQ